MPFRICVIGCGGIANAMHGPSYVKYRREENPDAILAGCCDVDPSRAEAFRAKFGFDRAYADIHAMLAVEKPDAVCLLSPVEYTAALAENILERGIPLLLEKPPGRTRAEACRLIEVAERKGTPHRVAFNRRYAPLIRTLREALDAETKSNPIQSLNYDMFRINRRDEDFSTTAIHAIDAARFIAGADYRMIAFTYHEHPELGAHVADIHMQCEMVGGAVVTLNLCPVTGINVERATVNLYDNTFFMDHTANALHPNGRLVWARRGEIQIDLSGNMDGAETFDREGFYHENRTFFGDIIAGRVPSGNLQSSLQSVEVADCIRRRLREFSGK